MQSAEFGGTIKRKLSIARLSPIWGLDIETQLQVHKPECDGLYHWSLSLTSHLSVDAIISSQVTVLCE
jgi:hypothetical protein